MKTVALIAVTCLVLFLCLSVTAAPVLTNGTVTTFIGDSNYMYLEAADGKLHRLQTPILDLVQMDDENLICLTQEYRLYSVRLDGSSSSMISSNATDDVLSALRSEPPYELNDRILSRQGDEFAKSVLAGNCIAACSNHDTIFYLQEDAQSSAYTLHAAPIDVLRTSFSSILEGRNTIEPLSMTASKDAVCIVGKDTSVQVFSIPTGEVQIIPASETVPDIACAIYAAGSILTYTMDDSGFMHISNSFDPVIHFEAQTSIVSDVTYTPTVSPGPTVTPTLVPVVTLIPTRTPVRTYEPEPDDTIYYGAHGSRVRKMQQRLLELGYPVGKIDSVFGEQTLFALNLFQDAIGYTNRKSCTSKCYSRLMAKNAPAFDLYRPLKKGDKGKSVEIMQQMLIILGYGPDKADGIYGDKTALAVAAFQKYAALPVDGNTASANTLFALYTLMNPLESPTPTPIPTATPSPTPVVTATQTPPVTSIPTTPTTPPSTETPSDEPTESPSTAEPTESPAPAVPTEEPAATDTPPVELITPPVTPTEAPAPTESEAPVQEETPTPKPTESPTNPPEPTEAPTETPKPTEAPAETTEASGENP